MDCYTAGVLGVRPEARAGWKLATDLHRVAGDSGPSGAWSQPCLSRDVTFSFFLSKPVSGLW